MAKSRGKLDGIIISRVRQQHNSLLVSIPLAVRRALELVAGDYVIFNGHSDQNLVELSKFKRGGSKRGRDKRNSGRKNKRGSTRAPDGDA